jgi:hypothetical protein
MCAILMTTSMLRADPAALPAYKSTVKLQLQPHAWTAEVYADFAALLKQLQPGAELDASSIRVRDERGTILPTRFEPDKGSSARGLVLWNVPPSAAKSDVTGTFEVLFDAKSNKTWTAASPERVGPANLLSNGGFDSSDPDAGLPIPAIDPARMSVESADGIAASKPACLKLNPHALAKPPSAEWTHQNNISTLKVRVTPGQTYSISISEKAPKVTKTINAVVAGAIYWCKESADYVRHESFNTADTVGNMQWTTLSADLKAPAEAAFVFIDLSFYGSTGAAYIDDITIVAQDRPQITEAQNAAGDKKVSLAPSGPPAPAVESPRVAVLKPDAIYRFDFGDADQAVFPGFIAISPQSRFDPALGYGLAGEGMPQPVARDKPDSLARDLLTSLPGQSFDFVMDLPEGDYRVWLLIGDSGTGDVVYRKYVDWDIAINGRLVVERRLDARTWFGNEYFRHAADWWEPGVDAYDRFITPRFLQPVVDFSVNAATPAHFTFRGLPLCAMVVAPSKNPDALSSAVDTINAARHRALRLKFEPPEVQKPCILTDRDRERGYVLFVRDTGQPVLPGSAPMQDELADRLSIAVAPTQLQTFTLAAYPLKDLGDVTVTVSDLHGPDQAVVPASCIGVAVGRYLESSSDGSRYTIIPGSIEPRNPMTMRGDMTVRWWFTLDTPSDARPGKYQGAITFTPAHAAPATLPLCVEVLPINLLPTPLTAGLFHFDYAYGYALNWSQTWGDDPWLRQQWLTYETQNINLLKRYGLNSLSLSGEDLRHTARIVEGRVQFKPDGAFVRWMDLYASLGMKAMPFYGITGIGHPYLESGNYGQQVEFGSADWEKHYLAILQWIKDQERARHWPPVLIYTSDEASNHGAQGAAAARLILDAAMKVPGARTIASVNGPAEAVLLPGLAIVMPNHAYPITAQTLEDIRRHGNELWVYNLGTSRMIWGQYPWRIGALGQYQWFNTYPSSDPWNTFDAPEDYMITRVTPQGPVPTPALVEISEGLTDRRYLATLEARIIDARQSSRAAAGDAARAAQQELDSLRDSIPVDARQVIGQIDAWRAGSPAQDQWALHAHQDQLRLRLARHIVALNEALRQGR